MKNIAYNPDTYKFVLSLPDKDMKNLEEVVDNLAVGNLHFTRLPDDSFLYITGKYAINFRIEDNVLIVQDIINSEIIRNHQLFKKMIVS